MSISENEIQFIKLLNSHKLRLDGRKYLESREISLNTILHNKQPEIIKTSKIRKIDLVQNKEKTLMEFLSMTLLDRNRHHLSVIDWTCQKTGEKFRITPEDFTTLLEMPLKDILTKIDNNQ